MLSWTLENKYVFSVLISFPLDTYPEVGLPDHMIVLFLILWGIFYIVSYNVCTKLHPHQQCARVLISSHCCQDLFFCPFDSSHSRWYLIVVLIFISLMVCDTGQFFIYLLVICMFLLRFPDDSDGKESTFNAEDPSLIPGLERFPGEGNGYPLQRSCFFWKMFI